MKSFEARKKLTGAIIAVTALLAPLHAKAIVLLPPCTKTGDCTITDILVVFVNVAELLLGIVGAVALGYFIYGGFTLLISGGRSEQVQKGKDIIRNATIGIAIIFLSGVIVRFTTQALTGGAAPGEGFKIVGESCQKGRTGGIYVTVPAGFKNPADPAGSFVEESIECVAKDDCLDLNKTLADRNRPEANRYDCVRTNYDDTSVTVRSCVRGLCPSKGAAFACCLCINKSDNSLVPCPAAAKRAE